MGFALGIDTGVRVEDIVAEVLPDQKEHRRHQKQQQLIQAEGGGRPLSEPPARRQQHGHHSHGVHRPFDRRLPQPTPLPRIDGVKACDDLGLWHGVGLQGTRGGPYI